MTPSRIRLPSPNSPRNSSPVRKLLVRSRSAGRTEHVSSIANGLEQRRAMAIDLAAQVADMDIDRVRAVVEPISPDLFEDHAARQHLALVPDQIFEQLPFAGQQIEVGAAAPRGARDQVQA